MSDMSISSYLTNATVASFRVRVSVLGCQSSATVTSTSLLGRHPLLADNFNNPFRDLVVPTPGPAVRAASVGSASKQNSKLFFEPALELDLRVALLFEGRPANRGGIGLDGCRRCEALRNVVGECLGIDVVLSSLWRWVGEGGRGVERSIRF